MVSSSFNQAGSRPLSAFLVSVPDILTRAREAVRICTVVIREADLRVYCFGAHQVLGKQYAVVI